MGKLYLGHIKGDCQNTNKTLGGFCPKLLCSAPGLERVPRPMPDHKALPELCYLPFDKTPAVTSSGSHREIEDGTLALDDVESIGMFSKTFAVEESLTRKYLEHLEYIRLKKDN